MDVIVARILIRNYKPGAKNLVADHLSRLETGESGSPFTDCFPDETLYAMTSRLPWYADIVNYIVTKIREKIRVQSKYYVWDESYLWKFCGDQIIMRCVDDVSPKGYEETPSNPH